MIAATVVPVVASVAPGAPRRGAGAFAWDLLRELDRRSPVLARVAIAFVIMSCLLAAA